jgi:hypothetical protein
MAFSNSLRSSSVSSASFLSRRSTSSVCAEARAVSDSLGAARRGRTHSALHGLLELLLLLLLGAAVILDLLLGVVKLLPLRIQRGVPGARAVLDVPQSLVYGERGRIRLVSRAAQEERGNKRGEAHPNLPSSLSELWHNG